MTWVAVVFTPIVLVYQAWTYWVFRRRISTHHIPTRRARRGLREAARPAPVAAPPPGPHAARRALVAGASSGPAHRRPGLRGRHPRRRAATAPASDGWPRRRVAGRSVLGRRGASYVVDLAPRAPPAGSRTDLRRRLLARHAAAGPLAPSRRRTGELTLLATRGLPRSSPTSPATFRPWSWRRPPRATAARDRWLGPAQRLSSCVLTLPLVRSSRS